LGQQEIQTIGESRAAIRIDYTVDTRLFVFLGDDVNHSHFSVRIIACRRRSNDFYVLYLGGRNLLQGLRTGIKAGLPVDIYLKSAASAKGNFTIHIYPDGGSIFQNIDRRSAAAHEIVRSVYNLFVQLVDDLPFGCLHHYFGYTYFQRLQFDNT